MMHGTTIGRDGLRRSQDGATVATLAILAWATRGAPGNPAGDFLWHEKAAILTVLVIHGVWDR